MAAGLLAVASPTRAQAPSPVAPLAAVAAARAAMTDTLRGADLRVRLLTVDYSTNDIWDYFGHNLLWITNTRTGESHVWDWGRFDFEQPWFITRFLFLR